MIEGMDIVKRLRRIDEMPLCAEAADEIDRLREIVRYCRPYVLAYETDDVERRNLLANIDSASLSDQQRTSNE